MSAATVDASCTFDYVYAGLPDLCAKRENASGQSHQARHPSDQSSTPKHQLRFRIPVRLLGQAQTQFKLQSPHCLWWSYWNWQAFDLSLCKLSLEATISINIVKVPFRLDPPRLCRSRAACSSAKFNRLSYFWGESLCWLVCLSIRLSVCLSICLSISSWNLVQFLFGRPHAISRKCRHCKLPVNIL